MAYEQLFDQAGKQFNVDPALLRAQMMVESGGNPNAKSEVGAQGLMQIMPSTQRSLGVTDPNNPQQAIFGAAKLMAENLDRYGNVADAVKAYHGGTDQANWGPKTQAYVNKVLAGYGGAPQAAPEAPSLANDFASDFAMPAAKSAPAQPQPASDDLSNDFAMPTAKAPAGAPAIAAPAQSPAAPAKAPQPVIPGTIASLVAPPLVQQPTTAGGIIGKGVDAITGAVQDIGDGGVEGLKRGVDTPVEYLTKWMGGDYDAQVAADKARREAYDATAPGYIGQVSKLVGEMAGPVGEMAAGIRVLAAGGNALLNGIRGIDALSAAAPAVQAAGNFVAGNGGLISRIANMSGQGAVGAALTSGGGNETPLLQQMGLGAAIGGAFPVAGSLLGGAVKGGANLLKANVQPFTEGGQNAIVDKMVGQAAQKAAPELGAMTQKADLDAIGAKAASQPKSTIGQSANAIEDAIGAKASGQPLGADFAEYVPGSRPTLAQATGNSGVAELERAMISRNSAPFTALEQANNNARGDFLNQIRGTPETLADLQTAREAATGPMRDAALANATGAADVKPVVDTIKGILASPSGQQDAVVSAMNKVLGKLQNKDGSLQTDPAQLYGIRKNINNQLDVVAGKDSSEAAHASKQLLEVKQALDNSIEQVAPGFGDYVKAYADMSRPIDAQKFLQAKDLTDAASSQFSLDKTKKLLLTIQRMQSAPGSNLAKSITPEQMAGLQALHKDLQRQANSMLGTGKNSATVQLLNGNNLINSLSGNPIPKGLGSQAIGATIGGLVGGPVGAGLGGFVGNSVGNTLSNAASARAPEIESKLVDLLLGNKGPESLRSLVPKSQGSGVGNLLQRGLGAGSKP